MLLMDEPFAALDAQTRDVLQLGAAGDLGAHRRDDPLHHAQRARSRRSRRPRAGDDASPGAHQDRDRRAAAAPARSMDDSRRRRLVGRKLRRATARRRVTARVERGIVTMRPSPAWQVRLLSHPGDGLAGRRRAAASGRPTCSRRREVWRRCGPASQERHVCRSACRHQMRRHRCVGFGIVGRARHVAIGSAHRHLRWLRNDAGQARTRHAVAAEHHLAAAGGAVVRPERKRHHLRRADGVGVGDRDRRRDGVRNIRAVCSGAPRILGATAAALPATCCCRRAAARWCRGSSRAGRSRGAR